MTKKKLTHLVAFNLIHYREWKQQMKLKLFPPLSPHTILYKNLFTPSNFIGRLLANNST